MRGKSAVANFESEPRPPRERHDAPDRYRFPDTPEPEGATSPGEGSSSKRVTLESALSPQRGVDPNLTWERLLSHKSPPHRDGKPDGPEEVPWSPEQKSGSQNLFDEVHLEHQDELKPTAGDKEATTPDPERDQDFAHANDDREDTRGVIPEDRCDNFLMAGNSAHDLAEETVRKPNKPN